MTHEINTDAAAASAAASAAATVATTVKTVVKITTSSIPHPMFNLAPKARRKIFM